MGTEKDPREFLNAATYESFDCLTDCAFFETGYQLRQTYEGRLAYLRAIELCRDRRASGMGCLAEGLDSQTFSATGPIEPVKVIIEEGKG